MSYTHEVSSVASATVNERLMPDRVNPLLHSGEPRSRRAPAAAHDPLRDCTPQWDGTCRAAQHLPVSRFAADQNDPVLDQLFLHLAETTKKEESDRISSEIWERWITLTTTQPVPGWAVEFRQCRVSITTKPYAVLTK
ncbi:MAG: hypothetical protein CM1200mP20_02590 [Pseudomonadota bacterium]|nr:MAG: hypothetical protein CM1200mP20_02590 [Pseudomonadota bacterium]